MDLGEKYKKWSELYFTRFVCLDKDCAAGTNIPFEKINFSTGEGIVGDGTINMAGLLQLLVAMDRAGEKLPVGIGCVLISLMRLENAASDYFSAKFPFLGMSTECGFFLRDDIDPEDSALKEKLGLKYIISNYGMINTLDGEDPCHSPFVSQDQVWNLNPILMYIAMAYKNNPIGTLAGTVGFAINNYIAENGYTIYNPYLSRIYHFFTYLNLNEPYESRQQEREGAYRPKIKVKRGANNWYYSGGTLSCLDAFSVGSKSYSHNVRTFCHRAVTLFLDRVWDPILRIFGASFKINSIYCYAATSGIWYSKGFGKRLADRFNSQLEKDGSLFEANVAFIAGDTDRIKWNLVKEWLEAYPEPKEEGLVESPIEFLYVYNWFKLLNK